MRKLKVYGWDGWRSGLHPTNQTREIMAAHSIEEVYRFLDGFISRSHIVETGNDQEIAVAMAKPFTVFYHQLDVRPVAFTEAENVPRIVRRRQ